ncbi:MAG: hypothetical protein GTO14_23685 [Anaerolineales bacterium]|nr:hypothetical protein [Anaerolineales bacterium]
MLSRLLLSVGLIVLGWLIYKGTQQLLLRRRVPGLNGYRYGKPAILYFSSPDCEPCKTRQLPAIQQVQALYPNHLQVFEVDVTTSLELADAWGVLTLPTTFILDSRGRPRGVNLGVVEAHKLQTQLESIDETLMRRRNDSNLLRGAK